MKYQALALFLISILNSVCSLEKIHHVHLDKPKPQMKHLKKFDTISPIVIKDNNKVELKLQSPQDNKDSINTIINSKDNTINFRKSVAKIEAKQIEITPSRVAIPKSKGNCFVRHEGKLYDLYPLRKHTLKNKIEIVGFEKDVSFNLCKNIVQPCGARSMLNGEGPPCTNYSGDFRKEKIWKFNTKTIKLTLPEGDKCKGEMKYKTKVMITCDKDAEEPEVLYFNYFEPTCTTNILLKSKHACSTGSFTSWYSSFGVHKNVIGSVMMIIGLFLVFFGKKYIETTSSVIVAVCGGIIIKSFSGLLIEGLDIKSKCFV